LLLHRQGELGVMIYLLLIFFLNQDSQDFFFVRIDGVICTDEAVTDDERPSCNIRGREV
jgi:hypothetical protein